MRRSGARQLARLRGTTHHLGRRIIIVRVQRLVKSSTSGEHRAHAKLRRAALCTIAAGDETRLAGATATHTTRTTHQGRHGGGCELSHTRARAMKPRRGLKSAGGKGTARETGSSGDERLVVRERACGPSSVAKYSKYMINLYYNTRSRRGSSARASAQFNALIGTVSPRSACTVHACVLCD